MIKAIFFDFFNTLATWDPPRDQIHARACQELGVEVDCRALRRSLPVADEYYHEHALTQGPIRDLSQERQQAFYAEYESRALRGAGIEVRPELALEIALRVWSTPRRVVLFPDVLPTLERLSPQGLFLGIISNVDREIKSFCQELGLLSYLNSVVTSLEMGAWKPAPDIFLAALGPTGAQPSQAIHVGDNYQQDVLGAKEAGLHALLIDRDNLFPYLTDCPRLGHLGEVVNYL